MSEVIEGRFTADPIHSSFGFSAVHLGISNFRGTLDRADATLIADEGDFRLEGRAAVDSISIREPDVFRDRVLGADFFQAEQHPEVRFESTDVDLREEGLARVEGELTIAGRTSAVDGNGMWRGPITGPDSLPHVAIELKTTFDRREFGFDWQMQLPDGGVMLGWIIELDIRLELVRPDA